MLLQKDFSSFYATASIILKLGTWACYFFDYALYK